MAATKRTVAGAAAAIVLVAAAGLLAIGRQGGGLPGARTTPAPEAVDTASRTPEAKDQPAKKPATARQTGEKPLWRSLSPAQQQALQPLRGEWDGMDGLRKQKWLQLARRFSSLPPQEQERLHERMREWARLTPGQRELARETYNRARSIAPADKDATWQSYQQLPDDQKRKLAESAARKAPSVVPSQASGKAAVQPGQGTAACPAGTVKNPASATPACIPAPAPVPAAPAVPAAPVPPPEKQVPANWGITPNDA